MRSRCGSGMTRERPSDRWRSFEEAKSFVHALRLKNQAAAFFIPAVTDNTDLRCGTYQGVANVCRQVIQTNNVATDDRGCIYIVDRANTGLHVLELQGDVKKIIGKVDCR